MPQFDTHFFSSLIFWELISFGILLGVLYKYAWPPILEGLETRERKIRDSIEQAEQSRAAAEQHMKQYESKLQGAAREVEMILAAARDKAQRLLEENEQRLRADSEKIMADTHQEIDRERRKAVQQVREEAVNLAIMVAEKVVTRSLSGEDHRRFAQEALQAVASDYSKS